ncbi:MAG: hypothetical protein IKO61_04030 [Lachnospiraceae bacterium]|nr:hypothetical protein [Lachnospiraceae bacterium]
MPGPNDRLIKELELEMKKSHVELSPMSEMMKTAAEGFAFAEQGKKLFAVADYQHSELADGSINVHLQGELGALREKQLYDDAALRDAMKRQKLGVKAEIEGELSYREKEASYTKKKGDQEKDAKARSEQLAEVPLDMLRERADSLKKRLGEAIDDDDTLALGQREYDKQYLAVIEDLIETQSSKGKLFGNYKSHIALAKEKYYFYTQESARLIGKEQAKLMMAKTEYTSNLDAAKNASGFPDLFSTIKDINAEEIRRNKGDKAYETLRKAILEYREYAYKVYTLRRELEAINATERNDLAARQSRLAAAGNPIPNRIEDTNDTRNCLWAFKKSIETELSVWKFYADSCAMCMAQLSNIDGKPMINGAYSAHAGYVKTHFGVELDEIKTDEALRDQEICRRIGFESDDSDCDFESDHKSSSNGYVAQRAFEWNATEDVSSDIAEEMIKQGNLTGKEAREAKEACHGVVAMFFSLPALREVKDSTGESHTEILFAGHRERNGDYNAEAYEDLDEDEVISCVQDIATIRTSKDEDAVKKAILARIPRIDEAFDDIDAFMNTGKTAEIFTAKGHDEVFNNTAGLPSFEMKARQLRDMIGYILKQKQCLKGAANDINQQDMPKALYHKWMFLNRALSYVDYRIQIMQKGYKSTPEEWAKDTTVVESFWDKINYEKQQGTDDIGKFLMGLSHKLNRSLKGVLPSAAAPQAPETDVLNTPIAGEEENWSEEDKKTWRRWNAQLREAGRKAEERNREWDAQLEGFSLSEKRDLRRERYESRRYITREQQKDAIMKDLIKASDHAALSAELFYNQGRMIELDGKLDKLPAAAPGRQELVAERMELSLRQSSLQKELEAIERDAEEKTRELLKLVREPENKDTALKEQISALINEGNKKFGPNADGSEDSVLMTRVMPEMLTLKRIVDNPGFSIKEAKEKHAEIMDLIITQFENDAKPYILKCISRSKTALRDDVINGIITREKADKLTVRLKDYENKINNTDTEPSTILVIAEFMDSHMSHIEPGYEAPFSAILLRQAMNVEVCLNDMDKKIEGGKVGFAEVVNATDFDKESDELHGDVYDYHADEEEALKSVRKEQHGMRHSAKSEAFREVKLHVGRIENADKKVKAEKKRFMEEIRRIEGDTVTKLVDAEKPDEDVASLLYSLSSLLVTIAGGTANPVLPANQDEAKNICGKMGTSVLSLIDDDLTDQQVQEAVDFMRDKVMTAYEDIRAFVHSPIGGKMMGARRADDFTRFRREAVNPENYSDDIDGVATLRIKADSVFEVAKLLSSRGADIPEQMIDTLSRLTEFLEWRENILSEVLKSTGSLKYSDKEKYMSFNSSTREYELDMLDGIRTTDYVNDVMDDPEKWSHPAFVWDREETHE